MRSCENCGARVPAGATSCPQCDVFVGDYVDGAVVQPRKPRYRFWISTLVVVVILAALSFLLLKPELLPFTVERNVKLVYREPVRVVHDRPGGAHRAKGALINEAEATMLLRRHFTNIKSECVAILSDGYRDGGYLMNVVNGCDHTRLGRWRVDGRTKAITPASPASR
jgi:hypothetical protein